MWRDVNYAGRLLRAGILSRELIRRVPAEKQPAGCLSGLFAFVGDFNLRRFEYNILLISKHSDSLNRLALFQRAGG